MTLTHKTVLNPEPLPSNRSDARQRAVANRRIVIAAALFALLLIGEAALFMQAVRTIPDFLINDYALP
jgi:hypothetical protein